MIMMSFVMMELSVAVEDQWYNTTTCVFCLPLYTDQTCRNTCGTRLLCTRWTGLLPLYVCEKCWNVMFD
jgi:hypothetical protein